jgi:hypothetical protein
MRCQSVSKILLAATLSLLAPYFLRAQSDSLAVKENFLKYSDHILIKTSLNNRSLNFNLSPRINGITQFRQRLWYRPSVLNSLGISIAFKDFGISYSFKVAQNPLIASRQGKSDYTNLQLSSFGKKIGYDVFYQDYKGYFISNLDITSVKNLFNSIKTLTSGDTLLRRDDMQFQNYQANIYYASNSNKFSYRSAFVFDERQLTSGGSFIVNGALGYTLAQADSSIIPSDDKIGFNPRAYYKRMSFYSLAITPGYAYSLIFPSGLYATISASALTGLFYYSAFTETSKNDGLSYFLKGIGRLSAGYHTDKWIVGIAASGDLQGFNTKYVQFRTSVIDLSLFVAYRIKTRLMEGKTSIFPSLKQKK